MVDLGGIRATDGDLTGFWVIMVDVWSPSYFRETKDHMAEGPNGS